MPRIWIIRYAEIALKGDNRRHFEQALADDIKRRLAPFGAPAVTRTRGRIWVADEPRRHDAVGDALRTIPGIHSFGPAWQCPTAIETLEAEATLRFREAWDGARPIRFRVTTRRADKRYPMSSTAVNARIGAALLQAAPPGLLKVDLGRPELELFIELHTGMAVLYTSLSAGAGGLPVGTAGPVMCLLSGGIDSPVAAWQMIRRGCRVHAVFFENRLFLGRGATDKVERLAAHLACFQGPATLTTVPFNPIQTAIRDACSPRNRVVLYRRFMYRIAEQVMTRQKCLALVTGENLGQVASQTLENLHAVNATVRACVYRPLLCMDKQDIITQAERIGTYPISIEPAADCCSIFLPDRPVIKARLADIEADEARLDVPQLEADAMGAAVCGCVGA